MMNIGVRRKALKGHDISAQGDAPGQAEKRLSPERAQHTVIKMDELGLAKSYHALSGLKLI